MAMTWFDAETNAERPPRKNVNVNAPIFYFFGARIAAQTKPNIPASAPPANSHSGFHGLRRTTRDGNKRDQVTAPVVVHRAHQDCRAREHKANRDRRQAAADGAADRGVGIAFVQVADKQCKSGRRHQQWDRGRGAPFHPARYQPIKVTYMALGPGATCAKV